MLNLGIRFTGLFGNIHRISASYTCGTYNILSLKDTNVKNLTHDRHPDCSSMWV